MKNRFLQFSIAILVVLFFGCSTSSENNSNLDNLTDIDGNVYESITICNQTWTKSNLNVSKYTDGTPIPQVTDPTIWATLTTGAWCYYNNDPANEVVYGKLYNWYAVAGIYDAASLANPILRKKLAPIGWHVPSDTEWNALIICLDPNENPGNAIPNVAGGKMKSITLWATPNIGATNSSGFSGFPGGNRSNSGSFFAIGGFGYWWSSSDYNSSDAWYRSLSYSSDLADYYGTSKRKGFSVRCVKD